MSIMRSPTEPHTRGGSQPDLSKLNTEESGMPQVTFRKRKQPEQEDLKADFVDFITTLAIINTLNGCVEAEKAILSKISDNVSVIKDEIKSLQLIKRELVLSTKTDKI